MRSKLYKLSIVSFVIAFCIFLLSFYIYYFVRSEFSFTFIYKATPDKPYIVLLFGILGVLFLFSSIMSLAVKNIFLVRNKYA